MIRRVVVFGGRDWSDTAFTYKTLDRLQREHGFTVVIEGDARGADRIAGYWARRRGFDNLKFRAKWNEYGKAAGHIRNQQMIDEGQPDLGIAFPGGRGTADMTRRLRDAGIEVIECAPVTPY